MYLTRFGVGYGIAQTKRVTDQIYVWKISLQFGPRIVQFSHVVTTRVSIFSFFPCIKNGQNTRDFFMLKIIEV